MTLEKQTLIDKIIKDIQYYSSYPWDEDIRIMESEVRKILQKHLPQEDNYQRWYEQWKIDERESLHLELWI